MRRAPLLALILAALVSASCTTLGRGHPVADQLSCEVYDSFWEYLPERDASFFRPVSTPLIARVGQAEAPTLFERDTGRSETVLLEIDGSTVIERPIREEFSVDTTGYFESLQSKPTSNITSCFLEDGPPFHSGSFDGLYRRERLLNRDDDGFVTVWSISPVGFSADGNYALLFAEHDCGALCGGGAFYLLEKQGTEWSVIGDSWVWVS